MKTRIHNYIEEHRKEMINLLKGLVKINSIGAESKEHAPFGRGCADILEYIEKIYAENGFETELDSDGGYLLSYFGKGERNLGMFAHADTVAADDDWVYTTPFEPIEKDGFLIGRGVMDNKAAVVISLYCAKMLKELDIPFDSRLILFSGGNEETGMRDLMNYLNKHTPPEFSLVVDSGFPLFRGDKGILQLMATSETEFKEIDDFSGGRDINIILGKASAKIGNKVVTEQGISCHGALPQGSVNAGYLLAERIKGELNEDRKQIELVSEILKDYDGSVFGIEHEDEIFGNLTCTNGVIETCGKKLSLSLDIRYGAGIDAGDILKKIKKFFAKHNWTVDIISEKKPFLISSDNKYVKACLKAYGDFCGEKNPPMYINAGATYAGMLPCAAEVGTDPYGGKPEEMPEGHGAAHQPDECINIDGFIKAAEIVMNMLIVCDKAGR